MAETSERGLFAELWGESASGRRAEKVVSSAVERSWGSNVPLRPSWSPTMMRAVASNKGTGTSTQGQTKEIERDRSHPAMSVDFRKQWVELAAWRKRSTEHPLMETAARSRAPGILRSEAPGSADDEREAWSRNAPAHRSLGSAGRSC